MKTENTQRPPKRRKTQDGSNMMTVGGKAISLGSYLAPPQSKSNSSKREATTLEDTVDDPTSFRSGLELKPSNRTSKSTVKASPGRQKESTDPLSSRKGLPIWRFRKEIQESIRPHENNLLVIVGETGSGKSTQVPQFLYKEPWCRRQKVRLPGSSDDIAIGGTIAITQPRRVAATTLAHRVGQEVGTPLGQRQEGLVGYSVRFDHQVPKGTRIKFLTEGMLLQESLRDPNFRQYSAIVVDEIHERSLDVDLLVGLLKQLLEDGIKGRGGIPLKVIIMSATADIDALRSFFEDNSSEKPGTGTIQVIRIEGRQFPVEILYEARPVPDIQDALVKKIFKIHTSEPLPGDILAFLTGQEEIESAQTLVEEYAATLASNVPKIKVVPLYGQLSIEAQREAFIPVNKAFCRKIVLATNIAETSVTVPGVRYVIDCGKAKVKQYRSRLGLESLLAKPISKSSAIQRTGRAGREGPGKCFRLYTQEAFQSLQDADLPEILRNHIAGAVLAMKASGIDDVMGFPLIDQPEIEAIEKALTELHFLRAIQDDGTITPGGKRMARFPISASLGAVLLAAADPEFNCVLAAIDIISCITSGEDIFLQVQSEEAQEDISLARKEVRRREGDLITYLNTMQQYTAENADRMAWCKARKINIRNMKQALNIRRQLRSMCLKENLLESLPPQDPQPFTPISPEDAEVLLKCFLRGFATKTALLAPDASYVTTQGKHVVAIHPASVLHGQKREAIMFLDHVYTSKSYAKKVSAIQGSWIVDVL